MGVVVLLVLRSVGLNHPDQHTPRYGLRLGLGILLLAAAAFVAARKPRQPDPAKGQHGLVSRMVADPAPLSALLVGLLVFAPGVTFIAALQVIATAQSRTRPHRPGRDPRRGDQRTARVAADHAPPGGPQGDRTSSQGLQPLDCARTATTVLIGVLAVAGGIMVFDGIYGLV